ncbi:MAG: hypothetical protein PWR22_626 [Moorella sp. (in: firmicutes)]|jgi:hypothetical protein|nr:hypothetical protein [Moorella sp. (in: firmicutes)]
MVIDNYFEIVTARDGSKTLKYSDSRNSYWLHSSYNPIIEAKRWAEGINCSPDDIIIILGVGLGYHVNILVDKVPQGRIIAIEPVQPIKEACYRYWTFNKRNETGRVLIYSGNISLRDFLSLHIEEYRLDKVKVLIYKPLERFFPEVYLKYIREIKDALYILLVSANTKLLFSYTWVENFFKNLFYILTSPPASVFYNEFRGKPGIIVSAGPSLNKNIHLLKEAQGKAIILVVGTALRPVLAQGVKPTFAVSIDGSPANYKHFRELTSHDYPLVFDGIIYPEILCKYQGPKVASVFYNVFAEWLEQRLEINPARLFIGPSVASTAFDYAVKMGLDPIIFIGQDLAYSGEFTHARGTVYENTRPVKDENRLTFVEGIYEEKVITSYSMLAMLRALETQIAFSAAERQVIDATEGGARIAGTVVMTLRQALDNYCRDSFNPEEKIAEIYTSHKPLSKKDLSIIAEKIRGEERELDNAVRICQKGQWLAGELEFTFNCKAPAQRQIDKLLKRLDKIDEDLKELREKLLPVAMVFQPVWFKLNKGTFAKVENDWRAEGIRIAQKSQFLYRGLAEGIEVVKKAMLQVVDSLI